VLDRWPDGVKDAISKAGSTFAAKHGIAGINTSRPADDGAGPIYRFRARALAARLVDPSSGEVVAEPPLVAPGELPLEKLDLGPSKVAGLDILGIQLGDPLADAEEKIRAHMAVGKVIVADRTASLAAVQGKLEAYASGRIFVSESGMELIALFNEPPAKPDEVVGIWRMLRLPRGSVDAVALKAQLVSRYGEPTSSYDRSGLQREGIGFIWADFPPSGSCNNLARLNWADTPWRDENGAAWQPSFNTVGAPVLGNPSRFEKLDGPMGSVANLLCPAQLGVELIRLETGDPATADGVVAWLSDQRSYAEALVESRNMPRRAPDDAGTATDDSNVQIKF